MFSRRECAYVICVLPLVVGRLGFGKTWSCPVPCQLDRAWVGESARVRRINEVNIQRTVKVLFAQDQTVIADVKRLYCAFEVAGCVGCCHWIRGCCCCRSDVAVRRWKCSGCIGTNFSCNELAVPVVRGVRGQW